MTSILEEVDDFSPLSDDESDVNPATTGSTSAGPSKGASTSETINSMNSSISHVYSDEVIQSVLLDNFQPKTFPSPRVFESVFKSSNDLGTGNVFKQNGPAHIYVRPTPDAKDIRVCLDSGCGPVVGNRKAIRELFPDAEVRIRDDMTILRVCGGWGEQEYEVLPDFIVATLFMATTKGNLLSLQCEIHLTDAKVESQILIGMAALKSNRMVCDWDKEVLIVPTVDDVRIRVPIYMSERRRQIDKPLRAMESLKIPSGHEGLVKVDCSSLPKRDYHFQGKEWLNTRKGTFAKSANGVVDNETVRVVIANFGDNPITIQKSEVIGRVLDLAPDAAYSDIPETEDSRPYLSKKGQGLGA